jgi:hypothetical protein
MMYIYITVNEKYSNIYIYMFKIWAPADDKSWTIQVWGIRIIQVDPDPSGGYGALSAGFSPKISGVPIEPWPSLMAPQMVILFIKSLKWCQMCWFYIIGVTFSFVVSLPVF